MSAVACEVECIGKRKRVRLQGPQTGAEAAPHVARTTPIARSASPWEASPGRLIAGSEERTQLSWDELPAVRHDRFTSVRGRGTARGPRRATRSGGRRRQAMGGSQQPLRER
jgi:hypothetical protein